MDDNSTIRVNLISDDFIISLKTGIIKDLYANQIITQKQMEMAIVKLKQGAKTKC